MRYLFFKAVLLTGEKFIMFLRYTRFTANLPQTAWVKLYLACICQVFSEINDS